MKRLKQKQNCCVLQKREYYLNCSNHEPIPLQKYYMASSRELVRIVSIQKSPIINLFGESIAGASTIRGFGQEKRFMKRNLYLLDCFARPFFCSLAAIEWLCLRMELLSTFVFAFCMLLLVSFPRGSLDPSKYFVQITYFVY